MKTQNAVKDESQKEGTVEQDSGLNSDDDEECESVENKVNSVTNWSDSSEFVEKTQCAFNFNNSVIFDLDE